MNAQSLNPGGGAGIKIESGVKVVLDAKLQQAVVTGGG
jgi:hypothetical protein